MLCRTAYSSVSKVAPSLTLRTLRSYATGTNLLETDLSSVTDSAGNALNAKSFFQGKRVVLFGVPGAFTPVCSNKHVPSFIENLDALKAAGVDTVACLSVNDRFVMKAWQTELKAEGITMIADWNGLVSKTLGLGVDLSAAQLGNRCKRFAVVIENGVVAHENVEVSPGDFDVTGADSILKVLKKE